MAALMKLPEWTLLAMSAVLIISIVIVEVRCVQYASASWRWPYRLVMFMVLIAAHVFFHHHRTQPHVQEPVAVTAETAVTPAYAAVAYSLSSGAHGVAKDCGTLSEAERLALERCKEPDARVVVWSHHAWCARAVAEDRAYGFAWGHTSSVAEKLALEHCREHTKEPCRIAVVVFAGK